MPVDLARPLEADLGPFAVLDDGLAGKRVAFLGESNHFVHEKYAFRLLMIRLLHARGWRIVGEELAWSDGIRVDRFIESGDEAHLDRVTTTGYRGGERSDRDDSPTGILKDSESSYPLAELRAEQNRFWRDVRSVSESAREAARIRFFGLDADYHPWAGYEIAREMLVERSDALGIAALLDRAPDESITQEIARLDAALALPTLQHPDLERLIQTMRDSHDYVRTAHPARRWKDLREPMALRERLMHEHFDHVLNATTDEAKIALLAGDAHLAKDDSTIRMPSGAVGPGGGRVSSIGSHVSARLPQQVWNMWMLCGQGRDSGQFASLSRRVASPRGTLNAVLSDVGDAFVLPLYSDDERAAPLRETQSIVSMYGSQYRCVPTEQLDAIFFVREVSPLRV